MVVRGCVCLVCWAGVQFVKRKRLVFDPGRGGFDGETGEIGKRLGEDWMRRCAGEHSIRQAKRGGYPAHRETRLQRWK